MNTYTGCLQRRCVDQIRSVNEDWCTNTVHPVANMPCMLVCMNVLEQLHMQGTANVHHDGLG
jgi:hypothetical protein